MSLLISGWFGLTLTVIVAVLLIACAIAVDGQRLTASRRQALLGVTAILGIGWFVVIVLRFVFS